MSTHPLIVRIKALLAHEAGVEVAALETLAAIFHERLWLPLGFASSHEFCVAYLGMSEDTAWRRRKCADLLQRYPALVRPLIAERRVSLTNLARIHPLVNNANAERLIIEIVGKRKREVEAIIAREAPKPDLSSGIRTAPAPVALTASELCVSNQDSAPARSAAVVQPSPANSLEHRSADRHVMRVMLSQATRERLEQIKNIAPELGLEEIVARAFDGFHEQLERKRRAKLQRPTKVAMADEPALSAFPETTGPKTHTRYIDAETRRYVLHRDNYECQFVGDDGHRCRSKRHIQFHHLEPFARGGATAAANLKLYCRAHNLYQAELDFGRHDLAAAA
jgi:hypothetical protein